jgi:XTP/dITP diphosphohydrolase
LLTVLLTSPRVAPGLLSWPAWQALRSATTVLAPAGHPLLPALDEAGIKYEIAEGPADAGVWLAPHGTAEVPDGAAVIQGSADLPGAHFLDLVVTMDRLRTGCPWDAKQTHLTLAPHLLEEPYEALEALESGDMNAFRDELGDVLLQVVFHARIADDFNVDDVADGIVAKLVRRHPHVFGSVTVADADEVKRNWDTIKKAERAAAGADAGLVSAVDGVPFGQPALALAAQLQRRAERAGAPGDLVSGSASQDSPGASVPFPAPLHGAHKNAPGAAAPPAPTTAGAPAAIGDELLRVVAAARQAGVDPELALRDAARRYRDRVRAWERAARKLLTKLPPGMAESTPCATTVTIAHASSLRKLIRGLYPRYVGPGCQSGIMMQGPLFPAFDTGGLSMRALVLASPGCAESVTIGPGLGLRAGTRGGAFRWFAVVRDGMSATRGPSLALDQADLARR